MAPRCYPWGVRGLAALLLCAFVAVVSVTTAVSLGAYCLTSDTTNTHALPDSYLQGERRTVAFPLGPGGDDSG